MKHYPGICLALVTVTGLICFALYIATREIDHIIDHVRDAFGQVLHVQPQVTINQRVVLTQTSPIAELAVVTKEELVTIGFDEHLEVMSFQMPLTEKKFSAEATYRLKAGFDLREPFSVEIDPITHELHASLPHAKILSVEQIGDLACHGDDAWLNRITDEERVKIVNELNEAAHKAAVQSSLREDAEEQVTQRLKDLMQHNGAPITLRWTDAPLQPVQKNP